MTEPDGTLGDRRKRELIAFGYAHEDDETWSRMAVTSREMLGVERQTKGFSANTFFTNVTVEGLYRVAYVVLKIRGGLPKTVPYDEFVNTHDVRFRDPAEPDSAPGDGDQGDDDDETGSEVDPTTQTA
jgi:hypothetical protein